MNDNIEITQITFPNIEIARKLGGNLVEKKLAACCQIIPGITSVYYWEDKICEDNEVLMLVKAFSSNRSAIERYIIDNHDYDTPEFIVTDVSYVNNKYLNWAREQN